MKHTLRISVSKEPPDGGIVGCGHISVRERLLGFLLGKKRRLTVIVPGDSVKTMSITEEGGENDEQYCEVVMHVHDEIVIEADKQMSLEAICNQMSSTPSWADGLLLRADGFVCPFYKKD